MFIWFVAKPSLIERSIGIPPATAASNSKHTLFFSAIFARLSPCFAIKALFGVITWILFLRDVSTIFFEIPSDNPMHSNNMSIFSFFNIWKGFE